MAVETSIQWQSWLAFLAVTAETMADEMWVKAGSRAARREIEKQQRLKATFVELLAAIAAGFSSEMEREAIKLIKEWLSQALKNVLLLDKLSGGDEKN